MALNPGFSQRRNHPAQNDASTLSCNFKSDDTTEITEDVVKMGEMIWVKCSGIDERSGKVHLSRKAAMKEMEAQKQGGEAAPAAAPAQSQPKSPIQFSKTATKAAAFFVRSISPSQSRLKKLISPITPPK